MLSSLERIVFLVLFALSVGLSIVSWRAMFRTVAVGTQLPDSPSLGRVLLRALSVLFLQGPVLKRRLLLSLAHLYRDFSSELDELSNIIRIL